MLNNQFAIYHDTALKLHILDIDGYTEDEFMQRLKITSSGLNGKIGEFEILKANTLSDAREEMKTYILSE